jgi:hypothetical protein
LNIPFIFFYFGCSFKMPELPFFPCWCGRSGVCLAAAAAAFSTVICERRKSGCGSYVCHTKVKKPFLASEMGRIEHYIHFGLLLHIKEGDACF